MIPVVTTLLTNGLSLLANAFLAKGKEYIEEKTGVDLSQPELSEGDLLKLKQFQLENETELRRLQHEDNKLEAELEKTRIEADVAFHTSTQATARVEAQSADEYVRRTRPSLARKSFYAGLGYIVVSGFIFPVINAVKGLSLPVLDAYILGAIYAPCLTFVGVRSVEAFSRKGKT